MFLAIVIYKFIIVLLREKVKHEAKNKKFTHPHPPPFFNPQPPRLFLRCLPPFSLFCPCLLGCFCITYPPATAFRPRTARSGLFLLPFSNFSVFLQSHATKVSSRHPSPSQKQGKIPYAVRKNRIFQPRQKCPKSVKIPAVF